VRLQLREGRHVPRMDSSFPLRPSLFDTLSAGARDYPKFGTVSQFRRSILRNVEWILKTRRSTIEGLDRLPEASESMLNYGLPDLSLLNGRDPADRERIAHWVKSALITFENRLQHESIEVEDVTPVPSSESKSDAEPAATHALPTAIHLRIRGVLAIEPYREPITLDTTISTHNGDIHVRATD